MGYPESDGGQSSPEGLFGPGQGVPADGYGGMGNGGMGSEMEGMPTGMGGGGEPLGFRGEDGPPGHIPGLVNGPNNYDENSEVGRGGEENDYANRYSKQNFFDGITEGAMARMTGGGGQNQAYDERDDEGNERPDFAVTKAIGRPFQPDNDQQENQGMEQQEDSPFQQVHQESSFQGPRMDSLAAQASFAAQQMSPNRPGYGGPLGQEQEESPSNQIQQPEDEESQPGVQGFRGPQEDARFRATSMSGGEAVLGMNDQEGVKRLKISKNNKKLFIKTTKRKLSKGKREKPYTTS